LIFDMDGTIIDSMPSHAQSWVAFVQNHGIHIDVPDLMRRTTGRTGAECMRELFQRDMSDEEAWHPHCRKGAALPRAVCPHLCRGRRLQGVCRPDARMRGLKSRASGTAGDRHNIAFALGHLKLPTCRPTPSPAATKG
jgi:beta-phosphoglucomutase-like phosphatase (HAD superfamily)